MSNVTETRHHLKFGDIIKPCEQCSEWSLRISSYPCKNLTVYERHEVDCKALEAGL